MNSKNIEDIYPLSPMQQGILFHCLYTPTSRVYVQQLSFDLHGNLNVSALEQAWQQVVDRHSVLRTAFMWEKTEQPLQVVGRHLKLTLEKYDWRELSLLEQKTQLEAFALLERKSGFKLSKAPLMRLNLIRLADDDYHFLWSYHHLLLDGWSLPLLLKEVFAFYQAFCQGRSLRLAQPFRYRNYIAGLLQQDLTAAELFWQQQLKGFTSPTALRVDRLTSSLVDIESYAEKQILLSADVTIALQSLARQQQLTLNTIVQGAWALLLSRYSDEDDVVFGATLSGRSPTLAGAESMVGLFINTLPVRVKICAETSLLTWLKQLQADQVEVRQYEYSPLVKVQGWSEVLRGTPLFESIVVFENYPIDASLQSLQSQNANLRIYNLRSVEQTNYPLTVIVEAQSQLSLKLMYDSQRFDTATIARMLGHFKTLLENIAVKPEDRLINLSMLTETEQHQLLVNWNNTQTEYSQAL
jgi:hypothetical protein